MKKLFIIYLLFGLLFTTYSQQTLVASDLRPDNYIEDVVENYNKTAACGTPWVSSGYPPWTNYWGGYQFNIVNLNAVDDIRIHSFEARFQGTAGYRIYTKTGTFVGFETNAAAWTLVGSIGGGLTGISTVAPTPIPIPVEICIPPGATQAFYLSRSNNNAANRHLYVPGSGIGGTTIYASDANLGITEAFYVTPYFATLYAQVRRPSLDVCYSVGCVILPVELIDFSVKNDDYTNKLFWATFTEINNDYFLIERSIDNISWEPICTMDGVGNSIEKTVYRFNDKDYSKTVNYYRLTQIDYNGNSEVLGSISIDNTIKSKELVKVTNLMGQEVSDIYIGVVIMYYNDGTTIKTIQNIK